MATAIVAQHQFTVVCISLNVGAVSLAPEPTHIAPARPTTSATNNKCDNAR